MALANRAPADPVILAPPAQPEAPPSPPPRPAPKTGINRIAEMHAMRYEPNEVTVNEEGAIEDYGEYAEDLLAVRPVSCAFGCGSPNGLRTQDDAMLFITVRSASPADVPRVLQVVDQVKRLRHKRGTYSRPHPAPHRSHLPSFRRSKRRRPPRRAQPIRRLRRPATCPTAHQARRSPGEHIHAPDESNRTSKQDPHA
jgi:hypothetical protein